ncbi:MAG: ECF transporter S component [Lachnospiraceae bacterium]
MSGTEHEKRKTLSLRMMVQIAMLGAIAVVLMMFEIPLGFAPSFYKLDFSEVPVLLGAFSMGPVAGVLIELIKILLNLLINGTYTAGVGEFANFGIGCALVVPAGIIYKRKASRKNAVIGLVIGTIVMAIVGGAFNAYVLIPLYSKAMMPMDVIISMGNQINPKITGLSTFIMFAVVPFNLVKGLIVSIMTVLLYKYLRPFLHT